MCVACFCVHVFYRKNEQKLLLEWNGRGLFVALPHWAAPEARGPRLGFQSIYIYIYKYIYIIKSLIQNNKKLLLYLNPCSLFLISFLFIYSFIYTHWNTRRPRRGCFACVCFSRVCSTLIFIGPNLVFLNVSN